MDTKKRKRETLADLAASSSSRHRCEDHASSPEDDDEWRDWAWLPRNVLFIIFSQFQFWRQIHILRGPGLACSPWRRVAREDSLLWREIDLSDGHPWHWHKRAPAGWKAMARVAVDRTAGRCESFRGYVDADVLIHLVNSAPLLTDLSIASWPCIPDVTMIVKKLPLLERLVLWSGEFQEELLIALLEHCPRLELLEASLCWPMRQGWKKPTKRRIRSSTVRDLLLPQIL